MYGSNKPGAKSISENMKLSNNGVDKNVVEARLKNKVIQWSLLAMKIWFQKSLIQFSGN